MLIATMEPVDLLRSLRASLGPNDLAARLGVDSPTLHRWVDGEARIRKSIIPLIERLSSLGRCNRPIPSFTFIDLFAGIGGMRLGFEGHGGRCVFTSEWNKYAVETYSANFSTDHPVAGDIRMVAATDVPNHDVLLAGFPCQPFSIAGVSKKNALGHAHGFHCATQGTLFFEIARIIDAKRPKAFLLENVKNLLGHDRGRTFAVIRRTLEEDLGYELHVRVVDGRHFVPQHRERTVIVGFRERTGFSWNELALPPAGGHRLATVLHPEDGSEAPEDPYTEGDLGKVNRKYVLTRHLWNYLKAYAEKHRLKGNGFGFGLVGPDDSARTLSARYYKDGSEILVKRGPRRSPRRLTPRECARLMGFDDPADGRRFRIPVSDTQAYKQFGNSVVVPVIRAVAGAMLPHALANEPISPLTPRQARLF